MRSKTYTLQFNNDDSVTVFEAGGDWVGVFRTYSHAVKFVRQILNGEVEE